MAKKGTTKVSFTGLKPTKKSVRIEFDTKEGKVSFNATKTIKKPVKVEFYVKKKK